MGGRNTIALPDLVIPSGGTDSNGVMVPEDAGAIEIFSPAVLTNAVTIQVEPTKTGTSWVTLLSGGSSIAVPVSSSLVITATAAGQIRVHSGGAEAAARTFKLNADIVA